MATTNENINGNNGSVEEKIITIKNNDKFTTLKNIALKVKYIFIKIFESPSNECKASKDFYTHNKPRNYQSASMGKYF